MNYSHQSSASSSTSAGTPPLIKATNKQRPLDSIQLQSENTPSTSPSISAGTSLADASSHSRSSVTKSKKPPMVFDYKGPGMDLGDEEITSPSDDDQNDETTSLQRRKGSKRDKRISSGTSGTSSLISPTAFVATSPAGNKCHATVAQRFSYGYPTTAAERRVLFSSMRMRPKNLTMANLITTPLTNGSSSTNESNSGDSGSYGATNTSASPGKLTAAVHDLSQEPGPDIASPRSPVSAAAPSQVNPPSSTPPPTQYRRRPSHYLLNRRRRHHFQSATGSATTASSPASMVNGQMATSAAYVSESAMMTIGADVCDSGAETMTPRENSSETPPSTTQTPALSASRSPAIHRYNKQFSFAASSGSSTVPLTGGATMPACAFNSQTLRSLDSIQRFGAILYSSVDESSLGGPASCSRWQTQWDKMNDTFDLDSINEFGDIGGRSAFVAVHCSSAPV